MNRISLNKVKLNCVSLNKVGEILSKVRVVMQEFWQQVVLQGVNKLRIDDMKKNSISSLTIYGVMQQKSTPTLTEPAYPWFSNGCYNVESNYYPRLPSGYARLEGISMSADTYYQITGFKLKGSDYLEISFTANKACNLIGCYTTADATDNYSIYLTTTSGGKYLRYADGTYNSAITAGTRYDIKVTPTGCTGFGTRSTWTNKDFTASVDMLIGSTSVDATSSKFDGIIHGNIEVGSYEYGSDRLYLIPCERLSDGVVGYYDDVSKKFYEPTVGGGVMTDYAVSRVEIEAERFHIGESGSVNAWFEEEIKVVNTDNEEQMHSRTGNVDFLLAVNDVADTKDLISGVLKRKIAYYTLTGDETFGSSTAYGKALYLNGQATKWGADRTKAVMCSHFVGLPPSDGTKDEGTCFFNASGHLYFRTTMTADEFKKYIKQQKATLKPVVIWYVLADEIVEQVVKKILDNPKGDCTIMRVANISYRDSSPVAPPFEELPFDVTCEVKADAPSPEPEEPQVTFPLNFTSDSVRIENFNPIVVSDAAIFTFNLGKRDDGTYWTDYLFDYYKSKLEWNGDYYSIPTEIRIFFNDCRATDVYSMDMNPETAKADFMLNLEENLPPIEGYNYSYVLNPPTLYWKEDGVIEIVVPIMEQ